MPIRSLLRAPSVLIFVLTLASFGQPAFAADPHEITVFAAASLSDALKEIGQHYETSHGTRLHFNLAGSNTLARQITEGAPADVFFSADEAKMNDLDRARLISHETRRSLLSNTLVIVVNAKRPAAVQKASDLATGAVGKLALAQTETVPAGIYARTYLTQLGIWKQVEGKVIQCENVRATLAAVATDNVDAGIVYKTDALISSAVRVAVAIPANEGPSISYPLAVVKNSHAPEDARDFVAYLESPEAQTVFTRFGFGVLPEPAGSH